MLSTQKSISDVRAFWDNRPCNIRRSAAPVGSPQFFEDTERNKYFVEPHIHAFAEFDKWADKDVLEIGCGIGIDSVSFAKAGAFVHALDVSKESLDLAHQRAKWTGWGINFFLGNAEELYHTLLIANYYDLVYAFGSIHHSPNPEKIIANAREVLKPGGTLKIMVYNKWSWKSLWVLLKYGHGKFWKFRELIAKYSEAQTGCPITHVYSLRELRAMLERNGFVVRKMYKDHVFPYEIEAYKRYEYHKVWYFRWMPAKLFRAFERLAGWHLMCEATC